MGQVCQCVCFGTPFTDLLALHDEIGGGIVELHDRTGCGAGCGLCVPYLLLVLRTRRTSFDPMWTQDFRDQKIPPGKVAAIERTLIKAGELPPWGGSKRPLQGPIGPGIHPFRNDY